MLVCLSDGFMITGHLLTIQKMSPNSFWLHDLDLGVIFLFWLHLPSCDWYKVNWLIFDHIDISLNKHIPLLEWSKCSVTLLQVCYLKRRQCIWRKLPIGLGWGLLVIFMRKVETFTISEVIVMIYWNTMKYTMKRVRRPAFLIWSSRGWRLFQSKILYSLSEFLAKAYIRLQLIRGFAARYWRGKHPWISLKWGIFISFAAN